MAPFHLCITLDKSNMSKQRTSRNFVAVYFVADVIVHFFLQVEGLIVKVARQLQDMQ